MKKQLMKECAVLFALLLVVSLAVFPAATIAGQTTNQEKAIDFMEKVLPSNTVLSKYTIALKMDTTLIDAIRPEGYNADDISYILSSENNELLVGFTIENGVITSCNIYPLSGEQAITNKPYTNMYDAATDFLKAYQVYTTIDSNNLIQMLNTVDLTKNSTITQENTKLTINSHALGSEHYINFKWENMINGAAYTKLDITFYDTYLLYSVIDTRKLYTIGDTSINVSMEQAIDIAIEGLKSYSYAMPDGSIVTNFEVQRDNIFATLETAHFDYELRPYWDVRLYLDKVYPGNVFAISAFIWANTGEIIEYGNMATGGTYYPDNTTNVTNPTDNTTTQAPNSNILIISIAVITVIAVTVASTLLIKKRNK
jgi:hypothetical protein